eukprot:793906-Pelagomonas_calceolata.AAC.1
MLGDCSFQGGKGVSIRAKLKFNQMNVPVMGRDLSRINVCRSTYTHWRPDLATSGRLWCRAEEPLPLGKNQSGMAREMFPGTCIP